MQKCSPYIFCFALASFCFKFGLAVPLMEVPILLVYLFFFILLNVSEMCTMQPIYQICAN